MKKHVIAENTFKKRLALNETLLLSLAEVG